MRTFTKNCELPTSNSFYCQIHNLTSDMMSLSYFSESYQHETVCVVHEPGLNDGLT
jgi:hypothetical protein